MVLILLRVVYDGLCHNVVFVYVVFLIITSKLNTKTENATVLQC